MTGISELRGLDNPNDGISDWLYRIVQGHGQATRPVAVFVDRHDRDQVLAILTHVADLETKKCDKTKPIHIPKMGRTNERAGLEA